MAIRRILVLETHDQLNKLKTELETGEGSEPGDTVDYSEYDSLDELLAALPLS